MRSCHFATELRTIEILGLVTIFEIICSCWLDSSCGSLKGRESSCKDLKGNNTGLLE